MTYGISKVEALSSSPSGIRHRLGSRCSQRRTVSGYASDDQVPRHEVLLVYAGGRFLQMLAAPCLVALLLDQASPQTSLEDR